MKTFKTLLSVLPILIFSAFVPALADRDEVNKLQTNGKSNDLETAIREKNKNIPDFYEKDNGNPMVVIPKDLPDPKMIIKGDISIDPKIFIPQLKK